MTTAAAQVEIRLLGGFDLLVDGQPVAASAFARRDPARLVKFLALAPDRRAHREQVIDAIWPELAPATVANRLHKAAHFVRRATGQPAAVVLDGESVALFPGFSVTMDWVEFERLAVNGLARDDGPSIEWAVERYRGDLLPHDPYDDWAFHHRQRLQLRHRELLRRSGRFTELLAVDPTDEVGHVGVMREQLAAGDRAGVARQFDVLADILERELGVGPSVEACELRDQALAGQSPPGGAAAARGTVAPRAATLATQQVHFCRTTDGVRLAYALSGSGAPLVKASNWLSHLDHEWGNPVWCHWWQELSARRTLVRYDERGCGLSDWDVGEGSYALDAWVRDLETVVDALGLERFPLLGISQGGPIAITYAARHPERVSHVIVYGTCARATWERAGPERRRELAALGELIKVSWGSDQPGFRQVYDAKFLPDGPLEAWRAFDELQRRSTSAANAHRLWTAFGGLDCADDARRLQVPTLILHGTEDQVWPYAEAEELHDMVRGSRLVPLATRNHILQAGEPAFGVFLDEVGRFLAG